MILSSAEEYAAVGKDWVTTFSKHHFSYAKPIFDIEDIAHGLSMTCRYGGQCKEFYSVAEHSVLVSKLMEEFDLGDPMVGLLHDGTEAYLSDVPTPFKQHLPEWRAIDAKLEEQLFAHFELPWPKEPGCKTADYYALYIEMVDLHPNPSDTIDPRGLRPRAHELHEQGWQVKCYDPWFAKKKFLERYDQLQKQTRKD